MGRDAATAAFRWLRAALLAALGACYEDATAGDRDLFAGGPRGAGRPDLAPP
eukprot:CAMPEP_0179210974 /NCGR_PEP_ID=MMETSP0797-20121207/103_1 /TAXON_ID=47934 /ORGANISM="Dinophysis acuminata, Strain DAEP01" /LENGTH=51 /DNA_ID=CAMNT_0020916045 /DNA_START=202 /DNA_END=355 /DNA_ORIENTATION=-